MRLLKDTDFKATIVNNTWNCLPLAGQDENSVTLLYITRAGMMQNIYHSLAAAAAAEAEVPLLLFGCYVVWRWECFQSDIDELVLSDCTQCHEDREESNINKYEPIRRLLRSMKCAHITGMPQTTQNSQISIST